MITETNTRIVEPGITVFSISGRLHLGNLLVSVETYLHRLIAEGTRKIVIDLTNLTYADSAATGMLIGVNGLMEQAGGKLRMAGAAGSVARSFDVVHMNRIVPLDADVDGACKALSD